MSNSDSLSEEERETLRKLRQRSQRDNYRSKIEDRLDGVPGEALDFADETGIEEYDVLGPERTFNYMDEHFQRRPYEHKNNHVLVSPSSKTIHYYRTYESRGKTRLEPLCKSKCYNMEQKEVSSVLLDEDRICSPCMARKKKLIGALIAMNRAKSGDIDLAE